MKISEHYVRKVSKISFFRYILSIDNADEIVDYVGDLLQGTEGNKKDFVDELVQRWQKCQMQAPDGLGGGVYKKEAVMGKYGHRCF